MVQYKRDLPVPVTTRHKPDNTYWAVGDPMDMVHSLEQGFRKKNYVDKISQPVTAQVVTDYYNRLDRGLLDYEKCTLSELEIFIKARRLDLPSEDTYRVPDPLATTIELRNTRDRPNRAQERAEKLEAKRQKAKKAAYIAVLHEADDAGVFDGFMTLPVEMRTNVYKIYHDDLPQLPKLPYQPPLTLASKTIRGEALPFFYEQSTFVLRLFVRTKAWAPSQVPTSRVSLYDKADDPDLLRSPNLAPAALARISRIRLRLSHWHTYRRTREDEEHVSWYIDLDGKAGPVLDAGGSFERYGFGARPYWLVRRQRLEAAVLRLLQDVAARPKAHRLGLSDLVDLQEAVQEALNPPVDG